MQLLIEEIGLTDTVDPLGGSYYIETLTNQMEARIVAIMAEIDAAGGIVQGVADGSVQASVSQNAYQLQLDLESGATRKVGVNCYVEEDEDDREVAMHAYDEMGALAQIESLNQVRASRDNATVEALLTRLKADCGEGRNVMATLVEAVKAYATVGELTNAMGEVFGRYEEPIRF